jgi:CBS domain-containing protein
MTQLLILILDDLKHMPDLLETWKAIGVPGVTIMESVGAYRMETWLTRVGLGSLDRLFGAKEIRRRTLLVAIDNDDLLDKAVAEAERIVGGFERPGSGLLLVLPTTQIRGIQKVKPKKLEEISPPAVIPNWVKLRNTPIEKTVDIINLVPICVSPDTPLNETAQAMLAQPDVHVACVVAEDGRLVGLISLRALADDIFFHIFPEEFLSEIHDLEKAGEFANLSRMRTAADAMIDPIWVKQGDTVKDAFKLLHENGLPGLPVVDEQYHVLGYINLLELLAVCLKLDEQDNDNVSKI